MHIKIIQTPDPEGIYGRHTGELCRHSHYSSNFGGQQKREDGISNLEVLKRQILCALSTLKNPKPQIGRNLKSSSVVKGRLTALPTGGFQDFQVL
jgi:hypothetical protein